MTRIIVVSGSKLPTEFEQSAREMIASIHGAAAEVLFCIEGDEPAIEGDMQRYVVRARAPDRIMSPIDIDAPAEPIQRFDRERPTHPPSPRAGRHRW